MTLTQADRVFTVSLMAQRFLPCLHDARYHQRVHGSTLECQIMGKNLQLACQGTNLPGSTQ